MPQSLTNKIMLLLIRSHIPHEKALIELAKAIETQGAQIRDIEASVEKLRELVLVHTGLRPIPSADSPCTPKSSPKPKAKKHTRRNLPARLRPKVKAGKYVSVFDYLILRNMYTRGFAKSLGMRAARLASRKNAYAYGRVKLRGESVNVYPKAILDKAYAQLRDCVESKESLQ